MSPNETSTTLKGLFAKPTSDFKTPLNRYLHPGNKEGIFHKDLAGAVPPSTGVCTNPVAKGSSSEPVAQDPNLSGVRGRQVVGNQSELKLRLCSPEVCVYYVLIYFLVTIPLLWLKSVFHYFIHQLNFIVKLFYVSTVNKWLYRWASI